MTAHAIEAHHLEYARRVLQVTPELEREKPLELQRVMQNFLCILAPEEATPEAMQKYLKDQERFASLPDLD